MSTRVQNFMQSPAPGKSSAAKQQSNRAFNLGTSERQFADTLKRALTDESKTERTQTETTTATQKQRAGTTKKADRPNESPDETEPLDSAVAAERARKGEQRPTDGTADVIEGDAPVAGTEAAQPAEKEIANLDSLPTPDEILLAAQMTPAPSPLYGTTDVYAGDVATDETMPAMTTAVVEQPALPTVLTPSGEAKDADAADDNPIDAEGGVDGPALKPYEATDAEDDTAEPRTKAAFSTPRVEKPTSLKLQAAAAGEAPVADAPAPDAPTDTEIENAVKPVQTSLGYQVGDGDSRLDLAQQSANPLDAKVTSVATTAAPTPEVNVAPAPVAVAGNHTAPLLPTSQAPQMTVPDFAEANHDKVVTSLRSTAFDKGGTMEIRLDPPELGALQVSVRMQDGVMTASFLTSNDEATRLLSHSLGQLKHVLESAGITVDKLQVQQFPKNENDTPGDGRHHAERDDSSARQEQQRKEMIKRMWQKLSGISDPLDLMG